MGKFIKMAKEQCASESDVFYLVRPDSVWCLHDAKSPEMSISFISGSDIEEAQIDFEAEGFSWVRYGDRAFRDVLIVVRRKPL